MLLPVVSNHNLAPWHATAIRKLIILYMSLELRGQGFTVAVPLKWNKLFICYCLVFLFCLQVTTWDSYIFMGFLLFLLLSKSVSIGHFNPFIWRWSHFSARGYLLDSIYKKQLQLQQLENQTHSLMRSYTLHNGINLLIELKEEEFFKRPHALMSYNSVQHATWVILFVPIPAFTCPSMCKGPESCCTSLWIMIISSCRTKFSGLHSHLCIDFHVEICFLHFKLTSWVGNLRVSSILSVHSCFLTFSFLKIDKMHWQQQRNFTVRQEILHSSYPHKRLQKRPRKTRFIINCQLTDVDPHKQQQVVEPTLSSSPLFGFWWSDAARQRTTVADEICALQIHDGVWTFQTSVRLSDWPSADGEASGRICRKSLVQSGRCLRDTMPPIHPLSATKEARATRFSTISCRSNWNRRRPTHVTHLDSRASKPPVTQCSPLPPHQRSRGRVQSDRDALDDHLTFVGAVSSIGSGHDCQSNIFGRLVTSLTSMPLRTGSLWPDWDATICGGAATSLFFWASSRSSSKLSTEASQALLLRISVRQVGFPVRASVLAFRCGYRRTGGCWHWWGTRWSRFAICIRSRVNIISAFRPPYSILCTCDPTEIALSPRDSLSGLFLLPNFEASGSNSNMCTFLTVLSLSSELSPKITLWCHAAVITAVKRHWLHGISIEN